MENCCSKRFPHRHKEMMQRMKQRDQMRRVNNIDEDDYEEQTDADEEQLVLRVDGKIRRPIYMEGLMCGKQKWMKLCDDFFTHERGKKYNKDQECFNKRETCDVCGNEGFRTYINETK